MSPAEVPPALLDAALKGTAVLLVALAAAVALRRSSAAARHLLWAVTVVALLALPALSVLLPRWCLPVSAPWSEAAPAAGQGGAADGGGILLPHARHLSPEPPDQPRERPLLVAARDRIILAGLPPGEPSPPPAAEQPAPPAPSQSWPWLLVVWAAGALLSVAWVAAGFASLGLLRRRCRPITEGPALELTQELAAALGIRRRVRLLQTDRRAVPMTWGVLRPVVLLPREAEGWPAERLRLVLLHELGHVRRGDCLTQLLGHLARALYWFHPLAWLAVARLKAEQEQACDDLVLGHGAGAADYAGHLLAVTAGLPADVFAPPAALGMGRAARIRRRLETLLDAGRDRRPVRRRSLALAAILAAAVVLPLSSACFAPAEAGAPQGQGQEQPQEKKAAAQDPQKRLDEVRKKLAESYVTPLDDKRLTEDALRGMIKALNDPHTEYISDDEYARLQMEFKGAITGIGVQLKADENGLGVVTPLAGSPALKAGLRPGDTITAINGKPTAGMKLTDAVKLILGPKGEAVKLRVVHSDGVVKDVSVTRDEVRFSPVQGFARGADDSWIYMIDPAQKVGYVQVLSFVNPTTAELSGAIEALKKDGMKGLILDLRFCPGGMLNQAVGVSRLFLPKGVIVTTRGPRQEERRFEADGKGHLGDFPMVVLLNENTASAAEIVAGALHDHKRAVLVGTRSYGKGSVTALMKLDEGGVLKLTTAYHYLPSGRNIQKRPGEKVWGVDPSDGFYLPLTKQQTEAMQKDQQLRRTVGWKPEDRPKWPERLTARAIEERHADPQLAAALRTMVARLTGGEFIKVGKSSALLQDHALRLEELRQRREALREDLERLDRDISDLQSASGKGGTPPK